MFWLMAVPECLGSIGSGLAERPARGDSLGAPWLDGNYSGNALHADAAGGYLQLPEVTPLAHSNPVVTVTGATEQARPLQQDAGGLLCRRIIPIKRRQVLAYRGGQVAGTYQILRLPAGNQSVVHRGGKLAFHTISQFKGMGIADIQSPVNASVKISLNLLSPEVLAADLGRGAAIAVTVTGQRLNTGRHP